MRIRFNDEDLELTPQTTVAALLAQRGIPEKGVAVALDWAVLPRSRWDDTPLSDGARVDVVTAVQGG